MLGRRAHSEAEVRKKLERGHFPQAEIDSAIARLKDLRYLDDPAFASHRAEALVVGGLGPRSAVAKVVAAGVEESTAEDAVEAAREGASETELALAALGKRRPKVDASSPAAERVRAARWLVGRGFSEETVRAILPMDEESPE
jgi:regulatory protein